MFKMEIDEEEEKQRKNALIMKNLILVPGTLSFENVRRLLKE